MRTRDVTQTLKELLYNGRDFVFLPDHVIGLVSIIQMEDFDNLVKNGPYTQ